MGDEYTETVDTSIDTDTSEDFSEDVSADSNDIADDIPEDIPEDVPEDSSFDSDDMADDIPEDIPEDVPEDSSTDSEDIADDIPEDIPEDVTEDSSSDSDDMADDIPEDIPEDVPEDSSTDSEDIADDIPEDIPEDVSEDSSTDSEDIADDIPEDIPEDVSEDSSADSDDMADDIPEDIPEDVPADTQNDAANETSSDETEDSASDISADEQPTDSQDDMAEEAPSDETKDSASDVSADEQPTDSQDDMAEEVPSGETEDTASDASTDETEDSASDVSADEQPADTQDDMADEAPLDETEDSASDVSADEQPADAQDDMADDTPSDETEDTVSDVSADEQPADTQDDMANESTSDETGDIAFNEQPVDTIGRCPKCGKPIDQCTCTNDGGNDTTFAGNDPNGGDAFRQLSEYMNEHNYGLDDFATYSQDPEWQRLHSNAYPDYTPPEASSTDTQENSFRQLSEYMNEHNYGSDDFATYSQDPEWQRLHSNAYPDYIPLEESSADTQENSFRQLSEYMNEHNYGSDDFATYSQDPEWQRLHNNAYPDYVPPEDSSVNSEGNVDYTSKNISENTATDTRNEIGNEVTTSQTKDTAPDASTNLQDNIADEAQDNMDNEVSTTEPTDMVSDTYDETDDAGTEDKVNDLTDESAEANVLNDLAMDSSVTDTNDMDNESANQENEDFPDSSSTDTPADNNAYSTVNNQDAVIDKDFGDLADDTSEKSAMTRMSEYMNAHNYGLDDKATYMSDPEWISINKDLKTELGIPQTAQEQMADYMGSHNYGIWDRNEYMKDPEWQSLNETLQNENANKGIVPVPSYTDFDEISSPEEKGKISTFFSNIFGSSKPNEPTTVPADEPTYQGFEVDNTLESNEDITATSQILQQPTDVNETKDFVSVIEKMDYNDLSDKDKELMYNTAKGHIGKTYGDLVSNDRINEIPKHIKIADTEECRKAYEASGGKYGNNTVGFYCPRTDEIFVDAPRNGDMTEIMATVEHESLHLASNGGVTEYIFDSNTGRPSWDLSTNVNEGITEMYAMRDMTDMGFDYKSTSYQREVGVVQALEDAIGKDVIRNAYFNHQPDLIRNNFENAFTSDTESGIGKYNEFLNDFNRYIKTTSYDPEFATRKASVYDWISNLKAKRRNV